MELKGGRYTIVKLQKQDINNLNNFLDRVRISDTNYDGVTHILQGIKTGGDRVYFSELNVLVDCLN